jgi:hypothetical protein
MGRFSAAVGSEGDIKAAFSPCKWLADACANLKKKFGKKDE